MAETPLQKVHREKLNLRIGPRMAQFVESRLASGDGAIPVIALDARTGCPLGRQIPAAELRKLMAESADHSEAQSHE